jgi:5S rRNA maturation endonuclease (ribonuclease M5)
LLLRKKDKMFRRLLDELSESRAVIIVEGKKDAAALHCIGISNPVFILNQSPDVVAERVSKEADEAVVLTDFDRKGEELFLRVLSALESHGVKPNVDVRRRLRYLFGVRFIEELDKKVKEFEERLEKLGG